MKLELMHDFELLAPSTVISNNLAVKKKNSEHMIPNNATTTTTSTTTAANIQAQDAQFLNRLINLSLNANNINGSKSSSSSASSSDVESECSLSSSSSSPHSSSCSYSSSSSLKTIDRDEDEYEEESNCLSETSHVSPVHASEATCNKELNHSENAHKYSTIFSLKEHPLYRIQEKIRSGGFGDVYKGMRKTDNLPIAIKVIEKKKIVSWTRNEVCALSYLLFEKKKLTPENRIKPMPILTF